MLKYVDPGQCHRLTILALLKDICQPCKITTTKAMVSTVGTNWMVMLPVLGPTGWASAQFFRQLCKLLVAMPTPNGLNWYHLTLSPPPTPSTYLPLTCMSDYVLTV